jgi:hypothetical protein
VPLFNTGPVRRTRRGNFEIRLQREEREVLAQVAPQLRELLDGDLADPSIRRLFPTAYHQDPGRDEEYQRLVRDDLADRRRRAVDLFVETLERTRLEEAELLAWMGAVNDLRLVLGTRLDVSEDEDPVPDPSDPDAPLRALYGWLGYLLESIVQALATGTR